MNSITTHVLDTSIGRPAQNVPITLERQQGTSFVSVGGGMTDADGRLRTLVTGALEIGIYRITFDTAAYFHAMSIKGFYPTVAIVFQIEDATQHYHVPLLINPYGYSTYRGS